MRSVKIRQWAFWEFILHNQKKFIMKCHSFDFFLSTSDLLKSFSFGFIILVNHLSLKLPDHYCCISFSSCNYSSNSNNTCFEPSPMFISYFRSFVRFISLFLFLPSPHGLCLTLPIPLWPTFVPWYPMSSIITQRSSQTVRYCLFPLIDPRSFRKLFSNSVFHVTPSCIFGYH